MCNIVLLVIAVPFFIFAHRAYKPTFGTVTYTFGNGGVYHGEQPLFLPAESPVLYAEVPLFLPRFHTNVFRIHPDDCIQELTINGIRVPDTIAQFCDYTELGPVVDIASYLRPGENLLQFTIQDKGGLTGVRITPIQPPFLRVGTVIVLLILLWRLAIFVHTHFLRKSGGGMHLIFLAGAMIRILYVLATPYTVRGHDTGSHIDYIRYVATNFRIPPAAEGFEFHQAPLYYFITGTWLFLGKLVGLGETVILQHIQIFSLLISIATLAVGIWIGSLVFPKKYQNIARLLFGGGIAVFPALVFLSSRITNDGLYNFLAFCAVAFLLRWWQRRKQRDWFVLCGIVAASILTKVSGLIFLPILLILLVATSQWSPRRKLRLGLYGMMLIVLMIWWLPVGRFLLESNPQNSLTFSSQAMHPGLRLPTGAGNLLTFDAPALFDHLYNSPWSDAARRQYFWEYWVRSALFGEFTFPGAVRIPAIGMLFIVVLLVPLFLIALMQQMIRNFRATLPFLLITLLTLLAQLTYRIMAPYAPNQDFRFSILLVVPVLAYVLLFLNSLQQTSRDILRSFLIAFAICSTAFFVGLFCLQ